MPDYFSARETLAESLRNRSSKPVPFIAIQCFGLELNETLSDVCRLRPESAAGVDASPSASAAANTTGTANG